MLELLTKYGISLDSLNFDALVKLRAEYESVNAALNGEKDKAESTDSELKKFLLATTSAEDEVRELTEEFKDEVRTLFYNIVDTNPRTVLALVEIISDIKSEVLSERDYWLTKVKQGSSPTRTVDADYEQKREDNAKLAELIRQLYPLLANLVPEDKHGDEYGAPEFPLEPKKVGGEPVPGAFLPKLSRLPRNQSDDNPTGRGVQLRNLRFTWNGEDVPADKLPSDVAHDYVSNFKAGFNIDWTGIRKLAKADGVEMFGAEPWTHEFPTGILTVRDPRPTKANSTPESEESN